MGSDAPLDKSRIAAIDATRDAGGENAGSSAVSAAAQAAHAAASAWHAGSSTREGTASGKHRAAGQTSGAITRVTADLAALNAYTAAAGAFVSVGYNNEDFVGGGLAQTDTLVRLPALAAIRSRVPRSTRPRAGRSGPPVTCGRPEVPSQEVV